MLHETETTNKRVREHARYAFQADAVDACVEYLGRPKGRHGIAVLPTGTGKSHVSAKIISRMRCKVLVLQPSVELLQQNLSKFMLLGGKAAVFCGKLNRYEVGDITYATLESVYRRGQDFQGYKMIIDEADDYPPEVMLSGKQSMIGQLLESSRIKHLLGLTASPTRLVRGELRFITRTPHSLWQDVVHVVQVQHAVEHGLWAPLKYKEFSNDLGLDYSGLRLNPAGTDFTEASMRHAFQHNDLAGKMAYMADVVRHHGRKSLLAFTPTVDMAEDVASKITYCEVITGSTPSGLRREIMQAWKALEIPMLVNVEIATIGVDHPKLDCVFHGRPTKSWRLWYQMNGRACRVDPKYGKRNAWVYDFTHNFRDFSRIESIIIENVPGYGWGVFTGEQKRLITGIPKDLDGKVVFTLDDCWKLPQMLRKWGFDASDYLYDGGIEL
jgi:DNA repair protein RadD